MKLLIDVPLVFMAYDDPGTTDQDRADSKFTYDDVSDVLTKFGVHHVLTYTPPSFARRSAPAARITWCLRCSPKATTCALDCPTN